MQTYPLTDDDYDEYYDDVVRQAYEELMAYEAERAKAEALDRTEWEDAR